MLPKTSYLPLPPLFFAAIIGILADRVLYPPLFFWGFFLAVPLVFWIPFRRSFLILIACTALFGLRHHDHWYRYAANDVGCYTGGLADQHTFSVLAANQPAAVIGTVAEMPRFYPKPPHDPGKIFETSEKTVFTLHTEQIRDNNVWIPCTGNLLVTVYADCRNYRIGDQIQLFGELLPPGRPKNPGDYDYADFLRGRRTLALLHCSQADAVTLLQGQRFSIRRSIESIRRKGLIHLEQHLSPKTIALAEAMIFGVREAVDEDVRQSMLDTGTMHLLAISGLHVSLIAGIAAWFLRLLGCSRRTAAVAMIIFVLFYLLLTDVRSPAIRATALTCTAAAALFVNRPTSAVNTLCLSALLILALKPSELFQFGTQLSFIAVGSFLWLPKYIRLKALFYEPHIIDEDLRPLSDLERYETGSWRSLRWLTKRVRFVIELFLISITIWIISLPILLSQVHLFTPIAILVNPLLWLPLTLAMFFGLLTAMLGNVPLLGTGLGIGADWSFALLIDMIAYFQRLGGHYWLPGPPAWWNLGFYSTFVFFTFLPIRRPNYKIVTAAVIFWIIVGIGAGYYNEFERKKSDRLTLSVLSVGHGNCVLITTPDNRAIVCDAGCLSSPQYAADVMCRALWRRGKSHIDAILISHPDNDHCNGIIYLADRFSIGEVLISPYCGDIHQESERIAWIKLRKKLESKKIPIRIVGDGDSLPIFGQMKAQILHPPKNNFADRNNVNATSLVLRIEHHGIGILLPGDLDGRETAPFLLRKPMLSDIVLVPHHGGRSGQAEKLYAWTSAKTLIFSTGSLTYKPEVLEQFRQKGFDVRSTFTDGAVEIEVP